jgi:hypothetical protein
MKIRPGSLMPADWLHVLLNMRAKPAVQAAIGLPTEFTARPALPVART